MHGVYRAHLNDTVANAKDVLGACLRQHTTNLLSDAFLIAKENHRVHVALNSQSLLQCNLPTQGPLPLKSPNHVRCLP